MAELADAFCLTVVDASAFPKSAGDKYVGTLVMSQIRSAHMILCNRLPDDAPKAEETLDRIRRASPLARPVASVPDVMETMRTARADPPVHLAGINEPLDARGGEQNLRSTRVSIPLQRSEETLRACFSNLPATVHRAKGVFFLQTRAGAVSLCELQYSGGRLTLEPGARMETSLAGQIVLIGTAQSETLDAIVLSIQNALGGDPSGWTERPRRRRTHPLDIGSSVGNSPRQSSGDQA